MTFYAVLGVLAFSFAIALGAGYLTDEVLGHERKGGFVFLAVLVLALWAGFAVIF